MLRYRITGGARVLVHDGEKYRAGVITADGAEKSHVRYEVEEGTDFGWFANDSILDQDPPYNTALLIVGSEGGDVKECKAWLEQSALLHLSHDLAKLREMWRRQDRRYW